MIQHAFDPQKPHRYFRYGRMSDPKQSADSPEQQFASIDRMVRGKAYPWRHVRDFRDDYISGRLMMQRPGFQEMLRVIRTHEENVDLILVDTTERFARSDELPMLRKELWETYGVLILDVRSNFASPLTAQGQIYASYEAIRATDDGRIKAQQVRRGKRAKVEKGFWPGGPIPRGFRLQAEREIVKGVEKTIGHRLVIDELTALIVVLLFEKAHETQWGEDRLAEFLNAHPQVVATGRQFYGSTVGSMLEQTLYKGLMVWPKVETDIIADRRVIQPVTDENEILRLENWCPSIVPAELFDDVFAVRKERGEVLKAQRRQKGDLEKQLLPPAPGMTVRYPLAGLVFCELCGAVMTVSSSGSYTRADGTVSNYGGYVCPRARSGMCDNKVRISEEWLRSFVFQTLLSRLFGKNCDDGPE